MNVEVRGQFAGSLLAFMNVPGIEFSSPSWEQVFLSAEPSRQPSLVHTVSYNDEGRRIQKDPN